jgi:NADH-quinone oxidoreductase subunit E
MAHDEAVSAARVESWLRTAAAAFPAKKEAVIPLLQAAQAEFGYLPRETMEGIARRLRIPPARVQGIATFYAQFRFHPPGKHTVTICRGTACHVRGSGKLLDELQGSLCVRPQETTADGLFTLETVACFGSCALAPVIAIGGQVHGQLSPEKARKLILGLRRSEGRASRAGRKQPKAGRPPRRK